MSLATQTAPQTSRRSSDSTFVAITTVNLDDRSIPERARTVGIFQKLEDARDVLSNDYGDLNEDNYYQFAVIETFSYGLYPSGTQAEWYEYQNGAWVHVDSCPVSKGWGKHQLHYALIG